ncbi:DHS-like NAD/FAD-binding domain-containing protein [Calycina marina]|uniref:DHS-like NAD/FAD-binding domain-containing protein n=1 Tax=Calycina marina TaxID=1763456 RepID=A0A9P8CGJ8_9HELO|nr:DHS-like NAD/FAD-binding domain-containing protein [Calycina marina]
MPTTNVGPDSGEELQGIADVLGKSKKVVVVTGAGISTNCGIPDFRSENGLYSMIQAQYDAALKNPPWETRDDYDIDDRPKKKRRRWYFEVVRQEDGEVVEVIDPDSEKHEEYHEGGQGVEGRELSKFPSPTLAPKIRSGTPQQANLSVSDNICSSPLSSVPDTPLDSADVMDTNTQSTLASSVTSTRSPSPIEASQVTRLELPNLKGKDLFDRQVWSTPFSTSIFYMFITRFRQAIQQDITILSPTHSFIKTLRDGGRLVRNYTQNIDCLEERMGLTTKLELGPGNRARFSSKLQRMRRPDGIDRNSPHDGGVEVVQLHGSLAFLRCQLCAKRSNWDVERESSMLSGTAPVCPSCSEYSEQRAGKGRRGIAVGRLRPDIVLYGEEQPADSLVGPIITHDLGLNPDVLLILGTSLRVHGLKLMVREFAKAVHSRGGKVVFINRTKPPESTWGDIIDYWVGWDCDAWVTDLKKRCGDLWMQQGTVFEETKARKESAAAAKRKKGATVKSSSVEGRKKSRPQCEREDKLNGAYLTLKILDMLRPLLDAEGNPSLRKTYWPLEARQWAGGTPKQLPPKVTKPSTASLKRKLSNLEDTARKKRKSLPSAPPAAHLANTSQPRQPRRSLPAKQLVQRDATQNTDLTWEQIRQVAPSLGEKPPPSGRIAWDELARNLSPLIKLYAHTYPADWQSTTYGCIPVPNLITHPPRGYTMPTHVPKHKYGTRAKQTPATPTSPALEARIKNRSSISNILSSPMSSQSSNEMFYDAQETVVS